MRVEVLFFAELKEMFGGSRLSLELAEGSSVDEALERLAELQTDRRFQGLPLIFAVNKDFETGGRKLEDRDRLAVMTPMSGG